MNANRSRRNNPGFRLHAPFVVVGGPDGVGKTTLAAALANRWPGPTAYFHFCPHLGEPLGEIPDHAPPPPPPKAPRQGSVLLGWVRLGRNLLRFWAAYLTRIRPATRRGTLVIGDRWAYGYVTQPYGLRFYGPSLLARLAVRWFPQPDYLLNLRAPPTVIHERKQELGRSEIADELKRWSTITTRRRVEVDATRTPPELAEELIVSFQVAGEPAE